MSLIIALPTSEGIALASDTHLKLGQVEERVSKVHRLNTRVCWSATGEYALIQRVSQAFSAFQHSTQSLRELYPSIGSTIKTCIREFLSLDFRAELYMSNINAVTQLHRAEFIFVECTPLPVILHMTLTGTPQWITARPFIIGNGDAFAGAFLRRYLGISLNLRLASVLSYRLLDDAIEAGTFGLKGPIDLWQIRPNTISQLQDDDLHEIRNTVETIKQHELAVFEKHLTMTTAH